MIFSNVVISHSVTTSGQTDGYDSDYELGSTSLSSSVREIVWASLVSSSNSSNQSVCECQYCSEPDISFHLTNMTESCVLHVKVKQEIPNQNHTLFIQAGMHVIHGLLSVQLFYNLLCYMSQCQTSRSSDLPQKTEMNICSQWPYELEKRHWRDFMNMRIVPCIRKLC